MAAETVMNTVKRYQLREGIYRRLAECYRPPDAEIGARVEEMSDAACELYPEIVKYLPDGNGDAAALRADFDGLFAGTGFITAISGEPARRDVQERILVVPVQDILLLCGRAGFRSEGAHGPGHIAFVLEFAEYLLRRMIIAAGSDDGDATGRDGELFRELITEHLAPGTYDFSCRVAERAHTAFYRDLARFTHVFIQEEAADLGRPAGG